LAPGSQTARTVAEVLGKVGVVLLHSRCGAGVAISHCAVNYVETTLPLVQPQLEVGAAAPRKILCPPLNVEDAVGRCATYRGEYAKPGVDQVQVVPVREDGVVVAGPRQASVSEGCIGGRELGITVGRQINAREGLVVQRVREWKRDCGYLIIPVIADVCRSWHDAAPYLLDHVLRA
jgi:hypothetical protein